MILDLRAQDKVLRNGSSCIDVGMTADQLDEALGTNDAVDAWVRFSYQAGGEIGNENDSQILRDESGENLGSFGVVDDYTITNTAQQTDARTLKILRWLETHDAPVRYFLPTNDPLTMQVHYHPAMSKDKGGRLGTAMGPRTTAFTLRGDEKRHVFDDLLVVQTAWPAAFTGAKDAAFAGA
jgi:hypothetical protein